VFDRFLVELTNFGRQLFELFVPLQLATRGGLLARFADGLVGLVALLDTRRWGVQLEVMPRVGAPSFPSPSSPSA
jgi:hypothetical protein